MEQDRIPLMDDWRFALTQDEAAVLKTYDDSAWRSVMLPHDWQIEQDRSPAAQPVKKEAGSSQDVKEGMADLFTPCDGSQGFFPRAHRGVYRLHFHAQEAWHGKKVRVLFDGIQRFSNVFLNGGRVGGRPYGYVPVLCDLTPWLCWDGENVLAVEVDNRGTGGDRWYSGAGIYRDVWLLVDEASHIAHNGVCIAAKPLGVRRTYSPCAAQAYVDVSVCVEEAQAGQNLCVRILLPDGICLLAHCQPAQKQNSFSFTLDAPVLWGPGSPVLYTAQVVLSNTQAVLDTQAVRFGVREIIFDEEEGLIFNGQKIKMYGVNLHHDGGALGAAVPIEWWRRRFDALKRLGINTLRCSHNPQAEAFYDLCDEYGFLVVDEIYDKWSQSGMYYDRFFDAWCLQDTRDMIMRSRNHPCVVLWSVGNEINHQYSPLFFETLENLVNCVREADPTRAVTCALVGFVLKDFNDHTPMSQKLAAAKRVGDMVDVFSGNYMEHFYEALRAYGMRKPVLGTEVRTYVMRNLNSVEIGAQAPTAMIKQHAWVIGGLYWAGIDYLGESMGWPGRGWTGCLLDSTGDWKLRAWYMAAQWQTEPVLKLAVEDQTELWDMARGLWGFMQVRAHWNYSQWDKLMHVIAMTNCDTVRFYLNDQAVREERLCDHPDGMIHVRIPFAPGALRAVGLRAGQEVAQDILTSDHAPDELHVTADRTQLPADGRSVAFVDICLNDKHGRRYMLENRLVRFTCEGAACEVTADNGDALYTGRYDVDQMPLHNGHLTLILRAGKQAGKAKLTICTEGFTPREIELNLV